MYPHPENFTEWENDEWSHYIDQSESIRVRAYLISENRETIADLKDRILAIEEQLAYIREENDCLFKDMTEFRATFERGEDPEADDDDLENIKSLLVGNH